MHWHEVVTKNIEKILVPPDLSESSMRGVGYAVHLAKTLGAEVTVLHVLSYEDLSGYEKKLREQKTKDPTFQEVQAMCQSQVRILVVDDERNIRNNLGMVLEAKGYKVDTVGNGDDALTRVKEGRYDMVFADIQMPKMNGLELLRSLRGLRPRMPVVMLTAYGTVGRAVEAMKLGAIDFIEKPFDPNAVLLLCEEILERQKIGMSGTVDELLHLAELARGRKAYTEARVYLKLAIQRDFTRPEPHYQLGALAESDGRTSQAVHYYYMALDAQSTFQPARDALKRLGRLDSANP